MNTFLTRTDRYYVGLLLCFCLLGASSDSFLHFQNSADVLRLRHLQYYNDLVEKYHQIEGRYPFESSDSKIPIYVFIANHDQKQFTKPGPPFAHLEISCKMFIHELEKVVHEEIFEFYDPQEIPEKKPNFYIYMVRGDTYSLTVHLHNPYSFTKKKTTGYNTATVSNHPNITTKAILPRRLFHNSEYKKVATKETAHQKLFEKREKKYLHDTKREPNNQL